MRQEVRIGVISAEAERARLRSILDEFEDRYGLPSERLSEAFSREDGSLDESGEFHAWEQAWVSYQILTGR